MTFILGINAFHGDSSACLTREGILLAASEEERFRGVKHWGRAVLLNRSRIVWPGLESRSLVSRTLRYTWIHDTFAKSRFVT